MIFTSFPVGEDKRPLCKWGDVAKGTQSDAPRIGIACGSKSDGLVVIDIDLKSGGFEGFESLEERGVIFPATRTVATPGGGLHLYYQTPIACKSSTSQIAPGVDVRAEGGYVVAPPSPGYRVVEDLPIALLPDSTIDELSMRYRSSAPRDHELVTTRAKKKITLDDLKDLCGRKRGDYADAWRAASEGLDFVQYGAGRTDDFITRAMQWLASINPELDGAHLVAVTSATWDRLEGYDLAHANEIYRREDLVSKYDRAAEKIAIERGASEAMARALTQARDRTEGGLEDPKILIYRSDYYLIHPELGYEGPFTPQELWAQARDRKVFDCEVPTEKGGMRPLTAHEMIKTFGARGALMGVSYDHTIDRATLDQKSKVLRLCGSQRTKIEPTFNGEIDTWLDLVGGDVTRDWIATCLDLRQAAPALFLVGGAGSGKSLLARGVAALYGDAPAVPLENAMGRFNFSLINQPIVEGQESIPSDARGNPRIEDLKRIVTETMRFVEPKGRGLVELRGASRVILSANNYNMIYERSGYLTKDDRQALADRLVVIRIDDDAARDYLHEIDVQRTWLDNGALTAHFKWLCENRSVKQGKRLRMDSHSQDLESHMIFGSAAPALVAQEMLDKLLALDNPLPAWLKVRDGEIYLAVLQLAQELKSQFRSATALRNAIASMCHEGDGIQMRDNGSRVRYRSVKRDAFLEYVTDASSLVDRRDFEFALLHHDEYHAACEHAVEREIIRCPKAFVINSDGIRVVRWTSTLRAVAEKSPGFLSESGHIDVEQLFKFASQELALVCRENAT